VSVLDEWATGGEDFRVVEMETVVSLPSSHGPTEHPVLTVRTPYDARTGVVQVFGRGLGW
jgi:hypothetical protein